MFYGCQATRNKPCKESPKGGQDYGGKGLEGKIPAVENRKWKTWGLEHWEWKPLGLLRAFEKTLGVA
jgi:hypothetical protein